jgi:hypothetical protein
MDSGAVVDPPVFDDVGIDASHAVASVEFTQAIVQIDTLGGVDASDQP